MSSTNPSKQLHSTSLQNSYESIFGYLRAVRSGHFIFVSGTTAVKPVDPVGIASTNTSMNTSTSESTSDDEIERSWTQESDDLERENTGTGTQSSKVLFARDAKKQADVAMQRCVLAVERLGGNKGSICRVRMYVSRHEDCNAVGQAFRECFGVTTSAGLSEGEMGAVATMVVVKDGFIDHDMLVETEVDAVVL